MSTVRTSAPQVPARLPPPVTAASSQQQQQRQRQQQLDQLFVHLSLRELMSRVLFLFLDRLDVYMTLSAVVLVPAVGVGYLISTVLEIEAAMAAHENYFTETKEEEEIAVREFMQSHGGRVLLMILTHVALEIFATILGEAGMVRAAANTHVGTSSGWFLCLRVACQQFESLLGASLLIYIPIYGGILVLAVMLASGFTIVLPLLTICMFLGYSVFTIYYIIQTRLVFPVIVVENKGPKRSLQRSFELAKFRKSLHRGTNLCFVVAQVPFETVVARYIRHNYPWAKHHNGIFDSGRNHYCICTRFILFAVEFHPEICPVYQHSGRSRRILSFRLAT